MLTQSALQEALFVSSLELLTLVSLHMPGFCRSLQLEACHLLISTAPRRAWRYGARPQEGGGSEPLLIPPLALGGARIFTLYCHSVFALFRCVR